MADPDGLAGSGSDPRLVRVADGDRARVPGDQAGLLAVAKDPDDRPVRVARLWAVIAVATVYAVEVGGEAEPAELPKVPKKLSTLKRGLLRLWRTLVLRQPMPKGKIEHHTWPAGSAMAEPLDEPYVHKG